VNQEESEHNEVDGMKKGVDSTGKVIAVLLSLFFRSCKMSVLILFNNSTPETPIR